MVGLSLVPVAYRLFLGFCGCQPTTGHMTQRLIDHFCCASFLPQPAMILQHYSAVNRPTLDEVTSNRNLPAVLLYIDDTSAVTMTNPGQERYSFAFSASAVVRKRGDDFPQNKQIR